MTALKSLALEKVKELVARFDEQIDSYKKEYNETQTRQDFINPFFEALGWDMTNKGNLAEAYREVIHEDKVLVDGVTKAPDYSFRLMGGKRLFYLEAKKPSVKVKDEIPPAYQLRRYGWSSKMPISIITDFEEFGIYDCTKRPEPTDKAHVARIKYITYKEYAAEWDFIWDTFSRERVPQGAFDKFVLSDTHKKGTATVDKEFLLSLDEWRKSLASTVSWNNQSLTEDEINFVVQQTIDRIIFLRIAEERHVEPFGNLRACLDGKDFYKNLVSLFVSADQKYNSGLFDFKKDTLSKSLTVDNKAIRNIIEDLYYPKCPYEFSVLPVEILGSAYEQFLGKQIKIDKAHRARIEEKPEVRKAGGVYYTPQYIVDYIVDHTVGTLIRDKSPKEVSDLRIVDPACGSGSFLLGAYQYLLDWHKAYYKENATPRNTKASPLTPDGYLTTAEKKRILLNNIYGVDIDTNAVEVTKLSLLLKCLEGETEASIAHQMSLWNERILPTLDENIKSGNSLIDTDYYDSQLDFGEDRKIKPFNWEKGFPEVFKRKERGFDVVIGNPPYVRQELLGNQKEYYASKYKVYHGMADLYSYFIEKSIYLLNDHGRYGVIVANKWMRANYGLPLRKFIKSQDILEIIDFGDLPVFEGVTTYPCILIAGRKSNEDHTIKLTNVKSLKFPSLASYVDEYKLTLQNESLDDEGWNLAGELEQNLLKKIQNAGIPLGEYVNGKIYYGIKTGLNEGFVIDAETKDRLIKEDKRSAEVIKPFLAGRDIKRYSDTNTQKYLIYFRKGFTNEKSQKAKNPTKWIQENYQSIYKHLEVYKSPAEKRFDKGEYWWELRSCEYYDSFSENKIMIPDIALRMQATYDDKKTFCVNTAYIIPVDDKYLLGILNSSLVHFYYKKISSTIRGGYLRFIRQYLETIPIPKKGDNQIIKLVDQLLSLHKEKANTKLQSQIDQIQTKIDYCEGKVDELVYGLYGLTEEERKVVEGG